MATRASLWSKWRRQMGTCSEEDLSIARSWFEELYQAGIEGKNPVARPLAYEERAVWELGGRRGTKAPA